MTDPTLPGSQPDSGPARPEPRKEPRLFRQRGMIQALHRTVRRVTRAKPGERFIRHYERHQSYESEHPLIAALHVLLGILLVVTGIAFSFLPILPGFVLFIPGVVLIASRSRAAALLLDRAELAVRRWIGRIRAGR